MLSRGEWEGIYTPRQLSKYGYALHGQALILPYIYLEVAETTQPRACVKLRYTVRSFEYFLQQYKYFVLWTVLLQEKSTESNERQNPG